jgi:hypothetical protein
MRPIRIFPDGGSRRGTGVSEVERREGDGDESRSRSIFHLGEGGPTETESTWRQSHPSGKLRVDAGAEEAGAFVEGEDLAAGEAALGCGEADESGGGGLGDEFDGDARVAVADAGFEGDGRGGDGGGVDVPLQGVDADFALVEAGGVGAVEGDEEGAVGGAFADDDVGLVVGVGGDADAFALAEGVEMEAAVAAELAVVGGADDGAGGVGDVGAEEIGHLHFADEADALAVFFVGGGETGVAGEGAEFGFLEVADGEAGVGELGLREEREEVGLVFVGIGAFEEREGAVVKPLPDSDETTACRVGRSGRWRRR